MTRPTMAMAISSAFGGLVFLLTALVLMADRSASDERVWLGESSLEHDAGRALLAQACEEMPRTGQPIDDFFLEALCESNHR